MHIRFRVQCLGFRASGRSPIKAIPAEVFLARQTCTAEAHMKPKMGAWSSVRPDSATTPTWASSTIGMERRAEVRYGRSKAGIKLGVSSNILSCYITLSYIVSSYYITLYTYIHTYVQIHIHTYIHPCMHTYIHAYIINEYRHGLPGGVGKRGFFMLSKGC